MWKKHQDGTFFCQECGTKRIYSNTYEYGLSNRGFIDTFGFSECPVCGDKTPYEPRKYIVDPFRPRCPGCGKKTDKATFCMHCGYKLNMKSWVRDYAKRNGLI